MSTGPQDPPVGRGFYVALWAAMCLTVVIGMFLAVEVLEDVDDEVCAGAESDYSAAQSVCGERASTLYQD